MVDQLPEVHVRVCVSFVKCLEIFENLQKMLQSAKTNFNTAFFNFYEIFRNHRKSSEIFRNLSQNA